MQEEQGVNISCATATYEALCLFYILLDICDNSVSWIFLPLSDWKTVAQKAYFPDVRQIIGIGVEFLYQVRMISDPTTSLSYLTDSG